MLAKENGFLFGHDSVQALIMAVIRHGGDFAYPVRDAHGVNRFQPAQMDQGPVVIAGAVADAMAAPVEACKRDEQEIRIDDGRALERFANRHGPSPGQIARPPEAKSERRSPANDDRQGGRNFFLGQRRQKRERIGFVAQRMKSGDNSGTPEACEAQSLLGEATAESGAGGRLDLSSSDKSRPAQSRLRISVGRGQGRVGDPRKASKHKARSRDGRWTVIPGAYVSRWEPYAEAHELRQGQPP